MNQKLYKRHCSLKDFVVFNKKFPRYSEMENYFKVLSTMYPNTIKLEVIGKSLEGRKIYMVKMSKHLAKKEKDITLVDATIHAREWLALSSALYLIDYVLWHKGILRYMDIYIIPCVNPDGYEYSHTTDRLWRKNRNKNESNSPCEQGVDLNRNFPFQYGLAGSSCDKTATTYRGKKALSEPESKAVADVLNKYKNKIKLYISLHSFGNSVLYPYGYTKDPVDESDILDDCGNVCCQAMRVFNNRKFKVGSVAQKMYIVSGNSTDYAAGQLNIKFSYVIELQKGGKSGFTPSKKRILEIGEEVAAGLESMIKYVYKYYQGKAKKKCDCPNTRECSREKYDFYKDSMV